MGTYVLRIWNCRWFWLTQVRGDLRQRYRRAALGVGWSMLRPVALTAILTLAFRKVFHREDTWVFAPYVLTGLICWDYVVGVTIQGCRSMLQGEAYMRQHPAPVAIYPLRTTLTETVPFLPALAVVLAFCWSVNGGASLAALASLVPTLLLLFALAWSLALLTGCAHVYFRDTQHLCEVGFSIVFYATPIIYDVRDLGGGRLAWLIEHGNPLLPFLALVREPLLHGQPPAAETFAAAALRVLAVGAAAVLVCARAERRLIFHF